MIENPWILLGVFPLAAYVIGATPFGVIIAAARGVDLRKRGSGNVGATNVARVMGRPLGVACMVLDMAKGLAPALAAVMLAGVADGSDAPEALKQGAIIGVAFGAIMGHVFSFWLKFRGGKGVATSLGVVLGIFPYYTYAGLSALGVWIAVTLISRYVSLGSIAAAVSFLGFFAALNFSHLPQLWPLGAFAASMVVLIIVRHRENISRLLKGTENKIGLRRTQ